jgi:hypothetical protein
MLGASQNGNGSRHNGLRKRELRLTARSEQINATAFRRYLTLLEIKLLKRFRKRNGTILFLWAVKPSPAPNPIRFSGIAERLAKVPYSHTATQPQI